MLNTSQESYERIHLISPSRWDPELPSAKEAFLKLVEDEKNQRLRTWETEKQPKEEDDEAEEKLHYGDSPPHDDDGYDDPNGGDGHTNQDEGASTIQAPGTSQGKGEQ